MKAAAIQMTSGDDVATNLAAARSLLEEARAGGATLAVLPENFAFMGAHERAKLAHAEGEGDGPLQRFLATAARELALTLVGGTIPLTVPGAADKVHAACLVLGPDGTRLARYDKIHLFDVAVARADGSAEAYRESATIAPGAPGHQACGDLGLTVCYDLRFPELYRRLAAAGARVLCVPSAFTERTGEAHWETLIRARAIENQCFVVAPNQCGAHPGGRRTWGHSLIVDPWGVVLAQRTDTPGVVLAELDFARLEALRKSFPVLEHRRL